MSELDRSYGSSVAAGERFLQFINGELWLGLLASTLDLNNNQLVSAEVSKEKIIEFSNITSLNMKLMEEYSYALQASLKRNLEVEAILTKELELRGLESEISEEEEL